MTDTMKDGPMMATMVPDHLPPPEQLLDLGDGTLVALMFYFTPPETRLSEVADMWGFDSMVYHLDDPRLQSEYDDGVSGADILLRWFPEVPEGWLLGGKWETEEDGPVAIFLRQRLDS